VTSDKPIARASESERILGPPSEREIRRVDAALVNHREIEKASDQIAPKMKAPGV